MRSCSVWDERTFLKFFLNHSTATEVETIVGWGHPDLIHLTKYGACPMFVDLHFRLRARHIVHYEGRVPNGSCCWMLLPLEAGIQERAGGLPHSKAAHQRAHRYYWSHGHIDRDSHRRDNPQRDSILQTRLRRVFASAPIRCILGLLCQDMDDLIESKNLECALIHL